MTSKKGNIAFVILTLFLILGVIGLLISSLMQNEDEDKTSTKLVATTETAETNLITSDGETENTNSESDSSNEFVLLESEEPTLQGKVGYFLEKFDGEYAYLTNKANAEEIATEENKVEGVKTFIGNQVYKVSFEDFDPYYFQLCGYTSCRVDADGYFEDFNSLRQEFTGKRIYVADSEEELAEYQSEWDKGQAILNGEEAGEYGNIIVNGRLLPYAEFVKVDDEYYIPLKSVGEAAYTETFRYNPDTSMLYLPMETSDGIWSIEIPFQITAIGSTHSSGYFTAGNSSPFLGDTWEEEFRTGDTTQCYVPASELSRYTGWYIYSNGDVISIVTDEPDVSDLFVLNTQGDRSASAQLDDGNTITKTTNPSDINMLEN